eukprot:454839-Hanusia_phi.AAC.11
MPLAPFWQTLPESRLCSVVEEDRLRGSIEKSREGAGRGSSLGGGRSLSGEGRYERSGERECHGTKRGIGVPGSNGDGEGMR